MVNPTGQYYVFGDDRFVYGPATMDWLQEWARQGNISSGSWIYSMTKNEWHQAKDMSEIQSLLVGSSKLETVPLSGLRPGQLRRLVLFADMNDDQLEQLGKLLEKVNVPAFRAVVKKGEEGDAMFLVMEGEARVVDRAEGTEQTLHTLSVGDFFGEVSLLDQGCRTADVLTNKESTFLKISRPNLQKLISEHPDTASIFLMSLARFLAARLRSTNKMFSTSLLFKKASDGFRAGR